MSRIGKVEIDILKPGNYPVPELLDEENFDSQMIKIVEPYIAEYRKKGKFGRRSELYYELYPLADNKGTVIISHGYMESSEKYYEMIYYLLMAGFQVGIFDLRGQGKSIREGNDPDIVHIDNFDSYVEDLRSFMNDVIYEKMAASKEKMFLFGHSLGASIGARYIEKYPGSFTKAILNSPMFSINFGAIPYEAAYIISKLMILLKQGNNRCIGHRAFDARPNPIMSAGRSESRYMYYHNIRIKHKEYQVSGSDYFWIREVIKAGYSARSAADIEKIKTDVLVVLAGQDDIADKDAQQAFVSKLKYGKAVLIPESKHETYTDRNYVLRDFLALIMGWYDPSGVIKK